MRTPNTHPVPALWRISTSTALLALGLAGGRFDSHHSARMAVRSRCAQIVSTQCWRVEKCTG